MNKILILPLFLLSHYSYFACSIPFSGEKYNSLINIKQVTSDEYINSKLYIVSFPAVVEGLKHEEAEFILFNKKDILITSDKQASTPPLSYIRTPIALKDINGTLEGVIVVSNKSELAFKVNVSWWPESIGNCPILATKLPDEK